MVRVKLFGTARLKAGVGTFEREVRSVDELMDCIPNITRREAKDLVLLVNGKPAGRRSRLKDGDEVVFLSPAGGG